MTAVVFAADVIPGTDPGDFVVMVRAKTLCIRGVKRPWRHKGSPHAVIQCAYAAARSLLASFD